MDKSEFNIYTGYKQAFHSSPITVDPVNFDNAWILETSGHPLQSENVPSSSHIPYGTGHIPHPYTVIVLLVIVQVTSSLWDLYTVIDVLR
jgi:hypothetical protein